MAPDESVGHVSWGCRRMSRRTCVCRTFSFAVYFCLIRVSNFPTNRVSLCVGPKGSVQGRWGGIVACCAGVAVTDQLIDASSGHMFVSSI